MGMVSLTLDLSIIRSGVYLFLASHGRRFGKSRFLRGWISSCGLQPMVGFLPWIIWCFGTSLWRIGAVCAAVLQNLWTIFSFIVLLLILCGCTCYKLLGFNGSCQVLWRVWCLVGELSWGNLLQTYGIWFLAVWCGLFGWKGTGALLRLWRERLFSCKLSAKILFLNGLGAGVLQTVLLWSFFLPLEVPLKLLFLFFFL